MLNLSDPRQFREKLQEILEREEFARAEPGLIQRYFNRIADAVLGFLGDHGLSIFFICGLLLTLALLGLSVWLVFRHRLSLKREIAGPGEKYRVYTPRWAREESREAANRGDYAKAIRFLLWSFLLRLEEEGVIRCHHSRTNGEYLRQLREKSFPRFSLAAELVDLYEKIWYGKNRCSKEDYERGLNLYTRLLEERG